jgi:predicted transcriptional regulator YdeE
MAETDKKKLNLTTTPVEVQWEDQHFLFVEKVGPFTESAPACWKELFITHLPLLKADETITTGSNFGMFKMDDELVYRAGVTVNAQPTSVAEGMKYELIQGGKCLQYTLTGSYSSLYEARERVYEMTKALNPDRRGSFFIQQYANSAYDTPEEELITHILVPVN